MATVSDRTKNLTGESAFAVLAEVNKLNSQGKKILSFCIGQPNFRTPDNICAAMKKAVDDGKHGYTGSAGIPELRDAIAKYESKITGAEYSADDVVVGAGAKAFIGYSVVAATEYGKGHEVIYPAPGYPIYESQTIFHGAKPVALPLLEERGFSFEVETLKELITPKTKLLFINSPQNPTGGVLGKPDLKAIADLAQDHDFWVYSDDVYNRIMYGEKFESIASIEGMKERTIVVDGASKTYAMTGWRLGWALNSKLAPFFTTLVTNTEACAAHMTQFAGVEALTGPQGKAEEMRKTFQRRRDMMVNGLNEIEGWHCSLPKGAFYLYPNVTKACKMAGAKDSEEFRKMLLHEAEVATLADIHFGKRADPNNYYLRFSYAASDEDINGGLARIRKFMEGRGKK
ncbi:MAG: pyridoxal phosphate-dependent aminotransferase [Candidatus Diapherotrites archaeon]